MTGLLLYFMIFAVPLAIAIWSGWRVYRAYRAGRWGRAVAGIGETGLWVLAGPYIFASGYCADDSWEWPVRMSQYGLVLAGVWLVGVVYDSVRARRRRSMSLLAALACGIAGLVALTVLGDAVSPITDHEYCG